MLTEIIAVAAIVVIVGGAILYIIKAKKSGRRCIGCPDSKTCSGDCHACSNGGKNNQKVAEPKEENNGAEN